MVLRRREPAAKRRRLLSRTSVGFSPFLRSLPRRLLRPIPGPLPRVTLSSKGKDASHVALPSEGSILAYQPTEPLPSESSSSSDEGSYLDEDEDQEEQEVEVVFDPPNQGDFHAVKLLLRNYLGDWHWDLSGFVDLILQQTKVGTVVKFERPEGGGGEEEDDDGSPAEGAADDDDVYAVISVLNLGRYAVLVTGKKFFYD